MTILITISQGQCIRDFLDLGIIRLVKEQRPDDDIVVLSPAHSVPAFRALCREHGARIARMECPKGTGANQRLTRLRLRMRARSVILALLNIEVRRFSVPAYLAHEFASLRPGLVVTTHPMPSFDYEVIMTARKMGIRTAGVVKSWDNIRKGFISRPHVLSLWNPVNYQEAIRFQGYYSHELAVNGAPSFDPYFSDSWFVPRSAFIKSLGLDPARPLITYATCGVYDKYYYGRDETHVAEDILSLIASSERLRAAQLVIRLHPTSRLEHFWPYKKRPDVALSFASYMPAIGWYPNRADLLEQVNLLRHSDVIVTPASSWGIEAAIFDTPTIVPVYSDWQPAHAAAQFDDYTLKNHYRPLVENAWVPIVRSRVELQRELLDALDHPGKWAQGRKAIVDNYVHFRDGKSCERVARWIASLAAEIERRVT